MTAHLSDGFDYDELGFVGTVVCMCGWRAGPFPDLGTSVDALMEHAAERAVADAVERPVAQKVAEALRGALLIVHHETHVGPLADCERCRRYAAHAVLAEWDATQEQTT